MGHLAVACKGGKAAEQFRPFYSFKQMKHFFTQKCAILGILMSMVVCMNAETVKIGQLYYSLHPATDFSPAYASVTYGTYVQYYKTQRIYYSGDIVVPSEVTYGGTVYTVRDIVSRAFLDCKDLTSISLPNTLSTIGEQAFAGCTGLTEFTLPESVVSIHPNAFNGCTGLTKPIYNSTLFCLMLPQDYNGEYTLPEVSTIMNGAFSGCTGLISIFLPNTLKTIGEQAFAGCTGLTEFTLPESVVSIHPNAFNGCTGLTKPIYNSTLFCLMLPQDYNGEYTLPEVSTIMNGAFSGCTGLTGIEIPHTVTSIGGNAFSDCDNLTTVTISSNEITSKYYLIASNFKTIFGEQVKKYIFGESVRRIGEYACAQCTNLESIELASSVTSIGGGSFSGCTSLADVRFSEGLGYIGVKAFADCSSLESVNLPSSCWDISDGAFRDCKNLETLVMKEGVRSIGVEAFSDCENLKNLSLPESVERIGGRAFVGCRSISKPLYNSRLFAFLPMDYTGAYDIPKGILTICRTACYERKGLTSVSFPSGLTTIEGAAFYGCENLESMALPAAVTLIGSSAFERCSKMSSFDIPDNAEIEFGAFPAYSTLNVKRGTIAQLSALSARWYDANYNTRSYTVRDKMTGDFLFGASLEKTGQTQTTATFRVWNLYPEFTYCYYSSQDQELHTLDGEEFTLTGLCPDSDCEAYIKTGFLERNENDEYYFHSYYDSPAKSFKTEGLSPLLEFATTASSITATGKYTKGDALVTAQMLTINGQKTESNSFSVSGLNPNTPFTAQYSVTVCYGNSNQYYATFSSSILSDETCSLSLTTQQPKIISEGNVIISAETNIDDTEENVGFEWRRTDWTNDFKSSSGTAYLYEGTMEGYIRNLNASYLWKYRPYYEANSGNRYYGEWVGIDPTNTSYFEPTVHTYTKVEVQGNAATVKGYAQRGTDNVVSQGFKYWKEAASVRSAANGIPDNVLTAEATGTVMQARLTGLDYESNYCYVAFVTTSENETFYGEQQTFKTGIDTSCIEEAQTSTAPTVTARYDLRGRSLDAPQPGLNIVRMSDGTVRKVMVK